MIVGKMMTGQDAIRGVPNGGSSVPEDDILSETKMTLNDGQRNPPILLFLLQLCSLYVV